MKRIFLFLVLNFAVMIALMVAFHIVCALLGIDPNAAFATSGGLDLKAVALFSLVWGMAGGFISLLLSKPMAKWSVGARTIDGTEGEAERWLVETVRSLAARANVQMPEVAIYHGSANAFATGAFKNHALVAVSDSIMAQMTREELRAVLGHEMSHVANGDMVTMTLVHGVMNTFVVFASRLVGWAVDRVILKNENYAPCAGYYITRMVLDIAFGFLAGIVVATYSRWREYHADAGSARLLNSPEPMIAALQRLNTMQPAELPGAMKGFGVSGGIGSLFASHPSCEDRIEALRRHAY